MEQQICVMGLGYVGLPTASLLATKGFKVRGVDINPRAVETINRGAIHFHEPDLDILVKSAVNSGNLVAAPEPGPADVFILAVPTPVTAAHEPDLSAVTAATGAIAPYLAPGNLVILESTSPVGTTEAVARRLAELRPELGGGDRVFVAYCPERVLPGQILRELVGNDRIVGGVDRPSAERARAFYQQFISGTALVTDARTAELAKLVENSYRDVNIAFANELSLICDDLGINVWELIDLANRHPRVNILRPGPGVGGHCIAVDPWFIVHSAPDRARLMRTAREVNDSKPHYVAARVRHRASRFRDPVIACLGLSYKADIDDLRESPAVEVVQLLAAQSAGHVLVVEPHIQELPAALTGLDQLELADLKTALEHADVVVLLVDHRVFRDVDRQLLQEKVVMDTRGLWR